MEDGSARGGAIQLGNLRLFCRTGGVHATRGVDAHFGAPAIHTRWPAYPLARQGLVASPHGRPWHSSHSGRGGERPQGHKGLVRARGRARFHTPAPAPSWGRSPRIILAGRLCQRRFEAAEHPFGDRLAAEWLGHRRPRRGGLRWTAARGPGDPRRIGSLAPARHGTQRNPNRDSDSLFQRGDEYPCVKGPVLGADSLGGLAARGDDSRAHVRQPAAASESRGGPAGRGRWRG